MIQKINPPRSEWTVLDCVGHLQRGDVSAMTEFVQLTKSSLIRFCYHLTNDFASAEELAQEIYVKVYTRIKKTTVFDAEAKFFSWLFTIAKNDFISSKRKLSAKMEKFKEKPLEDAKEELIERIPETAPADVDTVLGIQEALTELSEKDRMLLLLVDQEEYSYAEAGEVLGISADNVRFRLHQARKKFIAAYEKGGKGA